MIIDQNTSLMQEWAAEMNLQNSKPLVLFTINPEGNVSLIKVNEMDKEHLIDMCERIINKYKAM